MSQALKEQLPDYDDLDFEFRHEYVDDIRPLTEEEKLRLQAELEKAAF